MNQGSAGNGRTAATTVNLIGQGAIGGAVAGWLQSAPAYRLQSVIARGQDDWLPADLTIDTAGPDALRSFGPRLLAEGPLWTVGASALIEPAFRALMQQAAHQSGHRLRLFTPWIAGPGLSPASQVTRLHIAQSAPNLGPASGPLFDGPLTEAVHRFPHHLNTATAAALTGPGLAATTISLISSPAGEPHRIDARFQMPGGQITTGIAFYSGGLHPVSAAIIAALEQKDFWLICR